MRSKYRLKKSALLCSWWQNFKKGNCGRTEIFCLPHLERRETWFEANSAKLICAILDFPFFCFNWSSDGKEDNMQPLPLSFPIAINGSIRSAIMTPMSDGVGPSVDFDLRKLATPEFIVLRTSLHPLLGQWRRLWYSAVVVLKNCLLKAKSNQGMKSSREALFPGFIDHARFEEVVEGPSDRHFPSSLSSSTGTRSCQTFIGPLQNGSTQCWRDCHQSGVAWTKLGRRKSGSRRCINDSFIFLFWSDSHGRMNSMNKDGIGAWMQINDNQVKHQCESKRKTKTGFQSEEDQSRPFVLINSSFEFRCYFFPFRFFSRGESLPVYFLRNYLNWIS